MAVGVARIGDVVTGTCDAIAPGHPRQFTGVWDTGSDVCKADGIGIVRIGDTGHTDCNHHFTAVSGSDISTADGIAVHRVGDVVVIQEPNGGNGVTITGSDTVQSN